MANKLKVEVAFAGEFRQVIIPLSIPLGSTVLQAIEQSEIKVQFPEIGDLNGIVGIFGKVVSLDRILKEGDRIEIYRQLHQDPKEARRARAKAQRISIISSKR